MLDGLEDDEEESFLWANVNLIPVFVANVAFPADVSHLQQQLADCLQPNMVFEQSLQDILWQERKFEAQMRRVTRVKEEQLETIYLGELPGTKPVLISVQLQRAFRANLLAFLTKF